MKNFLFTALALVVLFTSETQAQNLYIENDVFDFGVVSEGTRVRHDFLIQNRGYEPLQLKEAQADCGCQTAIPDKNLLNPGEESKIQVTFDTSGFSGQKTRTVRLYSNDPGSPARQLIIRGFIKRDVSFDPPRAFFGDIHQAKGASAEITINVASGIKLRNAHSSHPNVKVDLEGTTLRVTLTPGLPKGVFREEVLLLTTSKQHETVSLPIFARVFGEVRLVPDVISFGLIEGPLTQELSAQVRVETSTGADLEVISLTTQRSDIAAELTKDNSIKVTLKRGLMGAVRSQVEIKVRLSDQTEESIVLPVYAIAARKGA